MVQRARLRPSDKIILPVLLSVMAWSLASPPAALAAPTSNESTPTTRKLTVKEKRLARRALRRAIFLLRKKRFDKAIAILKQAYDQWQSPSFLYNLAISFAIKGDPLNAVRYLRQYRQFHPGDDAKLPGPLRRAKEQVGLLVIRAPKPDISIYVDGELKGKGRVETILLPKMTVIEMRRGKVVLKTKRVRIEGGRQTLWEVDALPAPSKKRTQHPGFGNDHGGTKGSSKKSLQRLHWGYFAATSATALLSLAVAVGMSVVTRNIHLDFEETDRTDEDLAKKGRTFQTTANAMWAVTGTLTVAAAVLAVFTRWGKRPEEQNTKLQVSPTGATLTITW